MMTSNLLVDLKLSLCFIFLQLLLFTSVIAARADDKQFSILNKLIQIKSPTLPEINKQNFDDFGNSIKEKLRLKRRVLVHPFYAFGVNEETRELNPSYIHTDSRVPHYLIEDSNQSRANVNQSQTSLANETSNSNENMLESEFLNSSYFPVQEGGYTSNGLEETDQYSNEFNPGSFVNDRELSFNSDVHPPLTSHEGSAGIDENYPLINRTGLESLNSNSSSDLSSRSDLFSQNLTYDEFLGILHENSSLISTPVSSQINSSSSPNFSSQNLLNQISDKVKSPQTTSSTLFNGNSPQNELGQLWTTSSPVNTLKPPNSLNKNQTGETKLNSLSISEEKVDSNRLFGGNGLENDRDRVKSEVFSTTSTEKNIVLTRSSSSSPVGSTSTPTTTFFYNESSFETSTEEAVKDVSSNQTSTNKESNTTDDIYQSLVLAITIPICVVVVIIIITLIWMFVCEPKWKKRRSVGTVKSLQNSIPRSTSTSSQGSDSSSATPRPNGTPVIAWAASNEDA